MTNESFALIAGLVKTRSGIVLTPDKMYMLETRLAPLLKRENLAGLDALALRLRDIRADALAREVVSALTTNESSFFRDGRPFEHLRRAAVTIAGNRPASHRLRVWSAACSTGQEAYSIAMTLSECRTALGGRDFEILGTDIARDVVERARRGVFTQFEVQRGLPIQMLVRHFKQDDGKWRISEEMAARCRFEERNLIEETRSLGQFDIIFCRNVLIYFDIPTKAKVLGALSQQLAPDGVLYLGGAETVLGLTDRLIPVTGERGAYQAAAAGRVTSLAS
jgi:chemotaxis protein methyltransferase CheR